MLQKVLHMKKYFVNSKLNELGYDQIDFDENFVNEKYKKF